MSVLIVHVLPARVIFQTQSTLTWSPSGSEVMVEACSVSFVWGDAELKVGTDVDGAVLATTTESLTVAPFTVPSFGVTSTRTVSLRLPLPATERSSVSVDAPEAAVVLTVTPFTFQT